MLRAKLLEEWITLSAAAKILKVSPQAVHQMCEGSTIPEEHLRHIGDGKPIFLVRQSYVQELMERRAEAAAERAVRQQQKDISRSRRRAAGTPQLDFLADS